MILRFHIQLNSTLHNKIITMIFIKSSYNKQRVILQLIKEVSLYSRLNINEQSLGTGATTGLPWSNSTAPDLFSTWNTMYDMGTIVCYISA